MTATPNGSHSFGAPDVDQLVGHLHHAGVSGVLDVIVGISLRDRADLAAFCLSRTHLYEIGLEIAQHCDEGSLVAALGLVRGSALFVQSRERAYRFSDVFRSYRPKITLPGSISHPLSPSNDRLALA